MRTSTKLFIVLLACVLLSLWGYNTLLQKQLKAKNFIVEYTPILDQAIIKINLPAFKYVVIDGRLHYGDTSNGVAKAPYVDWHPHVTLSKYTFGKPSSIKVQRQTMDVVKHLIKNDTLYICFYKHHNTELLTNTNRYDDILKINAENLTSVKTRDVVLTTEGGFKMVDSLQVALSGHADFTICCAAFDKMSVKLYDKSKISLNGMALNNLRYSLLDTSTMNVDLHYIKHFTADRIDSSTVISIRGAAGKLKPFLK